MLHEARVVALRHHLPKLLEAQPELLGSQPSRKPNLAVSVLVKDPRAPSATMVYLPLQLHAPAEARGRLAVPAYAHVAGGDAADGSAVIVENLSRGETRGRRSTPSSVACSPSQRHRSPRLTI